jgi:hypothetical protein
MVSITTVFADTRPLYNPLWQIFDGHNGPAAAIYSKENLLKDVMSCMPPDLTREEWLSFLPRAMVAGFVKTDKDWQQLGMLCIHLSIQTSDMLFVLSAPMNRNLRTMPLGLLLQVKHQVQPRR